MTERQKDRQTNRQTGRHTENDKGVCYETKKKEKREREGRIR